MTTEELLKPRRKVMQPYPYSPFSVGDILHEVQKMWFGVKDSETGSYDDTIHLGWIEKCPNIFKPLHWWEDRKESDMPEYVKNNHEVIKILKWSFQDNEMWCTINFGGEINRNHCYKNYQPATKEEYQNQRP